MIYEYLKYITTVNYLQRKVHLKLMPTPNMYKAQTKTIDSVLKQLRFSLWSILVKLFLFVIDQWSNLSNFRPDVSATRMEATFGEVFPR